MGDGQFYELIKIMRCCILPTQVTGMPSMKGNIYRVVLLMHYLVQTVLHTVCDFRKESLDSKSDCSLSLRGKDLRRGKSFKAV